MRSVIQRVTRASVGIGGRKHSEIGPGLVLLLGIGESDDNSDVEWLAAKISRLRIFSDSNGVMNLSVMDTGGDVMVISSSPFMPLQKKETGPHT